MTDMMPHFAKMAPFRYDARMQKIWGKNAKIGGDNPVLDVRAWGYLTGGGHGALGLHPQEASRQQDAFGQMVADMLNEKFGCSKSDT